MRHKKLLREMFTMSAGKRFFLLSLLLAAGIAAWVFLVSEVSRERVLDPVVVNAKAAIIIDAGDGEVLFAKNADEKFPPASTAKVMTAVVAIEKVSLGSRFTPSRGALKVEPTVAGLEPGVSYRLGDLLAAILINSANDAAQVIAEGVSGSQGDFADIMNAKAESIGMENTYFANPSGLPTGGKDRQHTTVRDLGRMMRYALRYRIIPETMSRKEKDIYGSDRKRINLTTHNKALYRYDDAPWGKTGYTREARRTFVGIDPSMRPSVVVALLRSESLWNDIITLKRKGIELYRERHRTFFSDLARWVSEQRAKGRGTCGRTPAASTS